MHTVAYLRISTGGQALDSQRLAILDYAHRHGLTVHTFVEAQVSSRHGAARRGLDTVLAQVHPGDLILVSELSRLGRSVGQIIQLVDRLLKQRVQLVAIKENIRLNGIQDLQTKVMITLFGLFAEIERDLIPSAPKRAWPRPEQRDGCRGGRKGSLGRPSSRVGKPRFKASWPKRSRRRRSRKFWYLPARPCIILSSPDAWPECAA